MDKKTYYVSIPLQRIAAEAYDHTYKFRIAANDVELALLQEKIDQLADSEIWLGILKPVHHEEYTTERRHESEHLLKEIYEMIDALEVTHDTNSETSAKHLGELLK